MVKVPVIHEIVTSAKSIGSLVTGDLSKARQDWKDYSKESVIGSTVKAGAHAIKGDGYRAKRAIKGAGRATGHALVGGGLLPESIPIFKELNKAGKAFGDVITGDAEQAKKRFTEELKNEYRDPKFLQIMALDLAATTTSIAVAICTAGLGTVGFIAANAGSSAAASAAVNATDQGIDIMAGRKKKFDATDFVSHIVENGVVGGVVSTVKVPVKSGVSSALNIAAGAATKNKNRANGQEESDFGYQCNSRFIKAPIVSVTFNANKRLKPQLQKAASSFQLALIRKLATMKQNTSEITMLLTQVPPKKELARIRAESFIRNRNVCAVYEILRLKCKMLADRSQLIKNSAMCPSELLSCISTVIYAADRVEINDLIEVRMQFQAKYGIQFVTYALNNINGVLEERIVSKLMLRPPTPYLVDGCLQSICEECNVNWEYDTDHMISSKTFSADHTSQVNEQLNTKNETLNNHPQPSSPLSHQITGVPLLPSVIV